MHVLIHMHVNNCSHSQKPCVSPSLRNLCPQCHISNLTVHCIFSPGILDFTYMYIRMYVYMYTCTCIVYLLFLEQQICIPLQVTKRLREEQLTLHRHSLASSVSSLLTHTAAMVTLSNRHSDSIDYTHLQATITAV